MKDNIKIFILLSLMFILMYNLYRNNSLGNTLITTFSVPTHGDCCDIVVTSTLNIKSNISEYNVEYFDFVEGESEQLTTDMDTYPTIVKEYRNYCLINHKRIK